ncbi:MAG: glycoside hydrolase [Saprospiraceae bacterium]|nr:glycoside hydrolase [Saprospiraceae bacterium]
MKNKPILCLFLFFLVFSTAISQNIDPSVFSAMKWRMIGPHRGGRTVGAVGVPQQPNVFYIGVNNGGVWKTTDYGRTWQPIFDDQPTGSIGDVVVAPSNPNVLYVASGEGLQRPDLSVGDGIYKTTDGGKTWVNTGLREAQQIGGLAIDPTDENRVFAAVLGHPYGANTERGVYRTLDGGKSWERVYYVDENTGAIQVAIDSKNPQIIYADIWAGRQGPWENGAWNGSESGLIKSTDGGKTWKKLTNGLPTTAQGLSRIGFCIVPSNPNRLYATVDAPPQYGGIYRSDDAGENWVKMDGDPRLWGRGTDFAEIKADPKNADIVYSANVVTWKSTDSGKSWKAFRGAPGGDDYHRIWINPNNSDIILIASDQGAIITVNGGETFSSWYNQPTAQFYHVSTDNSFPYNVLGGQQESGSVSIASRSNDGQVTFHDWHPVGVEEYGYVAADPLDPNIIYGGKITKFDKRTGQVQNIAPEAVRSGKYRFIRTAPVLFSPVDNKTLYFAGNVLFKTQNGGHSWDIISPDLTRDNYNDIPLSIGIYRNEDMKKMPRRGVIYTVAPSPKDINTIWAGTDDGLIHVTRDGGKNWQNVTPPDLTPWSKVSLIDASHFDVNTAYAAVNCIRLDDMKPHIFRTKDGGKTWKEITNGLPNDPINVVREDPNRAGLLFAGSERAVYVSFDDGEHWQSLRLNMPATSIRDLVIKNDDIVVGTHGRSFWILDDITPLRQATPSVKTDGATLFAPQTAYRVRWDMWTDTPLPQEEPAGQNPPDGAIINYFLKEKAVGEVVLEVFDASGKSIRRFSSNDKPYTKPQDNVPDYWVRPQQILSGTEGGHRFVWDLHYTPLDVPASYPISAIYKNTAPDPTSPWVLAGNYTVKLTVNGKTYTQPLTVKMDPRVKTSVEDLKKQHDLSVQCYEGLKQITQSKAEVKKTREELKSLISVAKTPLSDELKRFDADLVAFEATNQGGVPNFNRQESALASIMNILQDADMPPTSQAITATEIETQKLKDLVEKLHTLKSERTKSLNDSLKKAKMKPLSN